MADNDRQQLVTCILLFLPALFLAFYIAFIVSNHIQAVYDSTYLLDRVINWPDGSTEHVQIGNDGYFRIDGVKSNLVGMRLGTEAPNLSGAFWESSNVALFEKELSYLESVGIRVILANFPYAAASSLEEERARYEGLMNQLTQHKMLVIAQIQNRWKDNFFLGDFAYSWWYGGVQDTASKFTKRLATYLLPYNNLISISLENEPNFYVNDQLYTPAHLQDYLTWMGRIIGSRIPDIPITVLLSQSVNKYPALAHAGLNATDWPFFTVYETSSARLNTRLSTHLVPFMQSAGYSGTGWWTGEFNANYPGPPYDISTAHCTLEFIDEIFKNGCALACLFCVNRVNDPESAWFDINGEPLSYMQTIAANLNRWQTPIDESLP